MCPSAEADAFAEAKASPTPTRTAHFGYVSAIAEATPTVQAAQGTFSAGMIFRLIKPDLGL